MGLALDAKHQAGLDQLILMPNYIQPFKDASEASVEDRLDMIRLSIEETGEEGISFSTYEVDKNFVSYTYDTLVAMKEEYSQDKLYFVVGTDAFLSIPTWKRGKDLLRDNGFIVGTRPGWREEELRAAIKNYANEYGSEVIAINNRKLDISATEIRRRIDERLPIDNLVMPSVAKYIRENELYFG